MIHLRFFTLFICYLLCIAVFADDSPILNKRQRPCTAIRVLTTTTVIQTSISISLSTATETSITTETLVSTTTATETVPTTATETTVSTETVTETAPMTATETSISTATITETSVSTTTATDISTTTDTAITITIISGSIPPPVTLPVTETTTIPITETSVSTTTATETITTTDTAITITIISGSIPPPVTLPGTEITSTTTTTSIPITITTTETYTQSGVCTASPTPSSCPTLPPSPNAPLCPITSSLTLTFDDLSTSWFFNFPLSYRSFFFSGQAGWLLLNTKSPKATFQERRASLSPPNSLYTKSYGMVRFGVEGNGTFDLVSSWMYAYNVQATTYNQKFFWVTIRTDKMAGDDKGGPNSSQVFPYAVPLGAFKGEMMNWERLGDTVRGVKWVEMAVWREWYWGQKGVEGNPVSAWAMDNVVVRKRKAC
ncbi:Protein of unknown function [Pyronema omphalodes CBS 100304]|uniref:Uncharacterized protein n=1 Tax=Pyronema omphalodes (strain CBS 100304) TaxID=1076935 RepID=U4LNK8_PYROM|nr:Protein of unknown function [Pyronema omphalodes CBS 100304]